ncbi:MAG: lipopolysaccharide heptosyltransferase II [Bryobacterales bacterium]|nr:lipopolysaccharide heptosyltransferase II [Bryobacterales bacterium]
MRTPNWLGDAVMSLPALRILRAQLPRAHLTVHARRWVAGLYARETCVDDVLIYAARPAAADWAGRWRAARELAARGFDAALLLPNSFDAALVAWLARIPRRIGYARDLRGPLLTDPIPPPRRGEIPPHQRHYYLELVRRAGWTSARASDGPILLDGVQRARAAGRERWSSLKVATDVVGVSPGAAFGGAKRWPAERFGEAAAQLARELGGAVAVFGSAQERALAEVVERTAAARGAPVLNLAGQTSLEEFIELTAACRLFLTNDSGAMHVAAALDVPTVAIFGSTDPEVTGPAGPRACLVRTPVECSPCLLRECPIDHRCMLGVSVQEVVHAARRLLSR